VHGFRYEPSAVWQLNRMTVLEERRRRGPNSNMKRLKRLEQEVSAWPEMSVHAHRFGGTEFRFGSAEVGHVHEGGVVDIPFPRSVRDALLALSRSTAGFQTRAGSRFTSEAKKTSTTRFGSCGCPIFDMR
jgi:hypothetical protein